MNCQILGQDNTDPNHWTSGNNEYLDEFFHFLKRRSQIFVRNKAFRAPEKVSQKFVFKYEINKSELNTLTSRKSRLNPGRLKKGLY